METASLLDVLEDIFERRGDVELEAGPWWLPVSEIIVMVKDDVARKTPAGVAALEPEYFWGFTADDKISVAKVDPDLGTYRVLGERGSGGRYGPMRIDLRDVTYYSLDDAEISMSYIPENREYYLNFTIPSPDPGEDKEYVFIGIPHEPVTDRLAVLEEFLRDLFPITEDPDFFEQQATTHRDRKLAKLARLLGRERLKKLIPSPKDWRPRVRTWA